MRSRAYTLVELLAVVILLGLMAGLGVPALVRMAQGDPLDRAVAGVRSRVADLQRFACGLGCRVDLTMAGWIADARLAPALRVDPSIHLTWLQTDGRALRQLIFDHRGRSVDWQIEIRHEDRRRSYRISGISGEWLELINGSIPPVASQ